MMSVKPDYHWIYMVVRIANINTRFTVPVALCWVWGIPSPNAIIYRDYCSKETQ